MSGKMALFSVAVLFYPLPRREGERGRLPAGQAGAGWGEGGVLK
jgi:hypothetical protein